MVPIDLYDELTIVSHDGSFAFECDDPSLPNDDTNLVVKAARLFFRQTGVSGNVRIRLQKRIPHGAGLGGGSSDAAATLMGLNELCRTGFTSGDLVKLGAELGSDVPFFLYRSAAWCRGRGEQVSPEPFHKSLSLILLKPDFGVPAGVAYERWRDARELPGFSYAPQRVEGVTFCNDLEKPVFEKFPILAELKHWLGEQPEVAVAMMSGSGSTMFAVLKDNKTNGEGLIGRARREIDPNLWAATSRPGGVG